MFISTSQPLLTLTLNPFLFPFRTKSNSNSTGQVAPLGSDTQFITIDPKASPNAQDRARQ
eukprot:CCRYP_010654-RA/>CCRYP_010654-RA protein AED:0.42 eAED:0.42 QI:107/1/1/1/0/0/2/64/59